MTQSPNHIFSPRIAVPQSVEIGEVCTLTGMAWKGPEGILALPFINNSLLSLTSCGLGWGGGVHTPRAQVVGLLQAELRSWDLVQGQRGAKEGTSAGSTEPVTCSKDNDRDQADQVEIPKGESELNRPSSSSGHFTDGKAEVQRVWQELRPKESVIKGLMCNMCAFFF